MNEYKIKGDKMQFNLYDLVDYLKSKKKAQNKIARLRLYNLGKLKQVVIKSKNRSGILVDQYRLLIHFDPEEIISYMNKVIQEHKNNSSYTYNKQHSEAWQNYIDIANYFKDK